MQPCRNKVCWMLRSKAEVIMNTAAEAPANGRLEQQTDPTYDPVDQTLDSLDQRFSVKHKVAESSQAAGAAGARASRNLSPRITTMIRLDHTHVLAAFRRYRRRMSPARKQALVDNVCLAVEIHAQLEEEIFYPALLQNGANVEELDQSVADHDEVRALINTLRELEPRDAEYDQNFLLLMRTVLHHVADEETTLIPMAEMVLEEQLGELGWQMTVRRMELLRPHAVEALRTTAVTFPVLTGAVVAGVLTTAWMVVRAIKGSEP